jgi:adenylate cyclase
MAWPLSRIDQGWIRARLYHLLAPLVALAVVWMINTHTTLLERLESLTVNLRFQARAHFDPPADPRLVFVGIDQDSVTHIGAWPWPRDTEADFFKSLAIDNANPHTVVFDILFSEDFNKYNDLTAKSGQNYDTMLADAAGLLPSVITGAHIPALAKEDAKMTKDEQAAAEKQTSEELKQPSLTSPYTNVQGNISKINGSDIAVFPVRPLRKQSLFGFVNAEPSELDNIRHTLPMVIRVQGKLFPSLALQTLCQMLNIDNDNVEINVGKSIILKNSSGKTWTIPINDAGEMTINYRNSDRFQSISFYPLFMALAQNAKDGTALPADLSLKNKVLLIGGDAVGLDDLGPTPFHSKSPLAFVHLNAIDNVLHHDYLSFVPWYWVVSVWLITTWITLLRLKDAPLHEAVLAPIVVVLLFTLVAFGILWLWSVEITIAWPAISYGVVTFWAVVLRWREEQAGREELKGVFSRMLSPEIMGHLLEHPENLEMGGSERPVTILFSDIRDYTKFSEGLKPSEVVRQLNVYFERMVSAVQQCRGTLHKYIGDAIMAAWGDIADASLGPEKDAQNAVRSALMMRRLLHELNKEREAENLMPLRIGIGLNHGSDVLVGLIGASSRSEFTVMGDAVNTASRLEGLTKEYKTDLAISESVCNLLGDGFLVRRLGLIVLKGKTKPTVVYEVLAEKSDLSQSKMTPEVVAQYEKAFDDFLARRFAEAEAGFLACKKIYPDDYCVKEYLKASREFLIQPPDANWDGRVVMTTK